MVQGKNNRSWWHKIGAGADSHLLSLSAMQLTGNRQGCENAASQRSLRLASLSFTTSQKGEKAMLSLEDGQLWGREDDHSILPIIIPIPVGSSPALSLCPLLPLHSLHRKLMWSSLQFHLQQAPAFWEVRSKDWESSRRKGREIEKTGGRENWTEKGVMIARSRYNRNQKSLSTCFRENPGFGILFVFSGNIANSLLS